MRRYSWPGNVRELENVIERAVILSRGPELEIEGLSGAAPAAIGKTPLRLQDVERDHIVKVLDANNWVIHGKGRAAEALGINPSTLRSRMKKLGIEKPKLRSSTPD